MPISLEGLDAENVGAHAELWEEVVRRVGSGLMPPLGSRPPDGATRAAAVTWLETELDRAAAANPPRGRPMTAHRLNRTEYRNAVRDLIGLDVDVEALLPPDDVSAEGFDNNADTLSTSTTLMERYLTAARRISQLAIGDAAMVSRAATYRVPQAEVQDDRHERGSPVGDARRPGRTASLPTRRRVHDQDRPAPQLLQLHPRSREHAAPARCTAR